MQTENLLKTKNAMVNQSEQITLKQEFICPHCKTPFNKKDSFSRQINTVYKEVKDVC